MAAKGAPLSKSPTSSRQRREPSSDSDAEECWICLSSAGELARPCKCPRVCHRECIATWQLTNYGRREENYCRFCQQQIPAMWKPNPAETPRTEELHVAPVMSVRYNGPEGSRDFKMRVRPGPEGLAAFKAHLKDVLGIEIGPQFDVTFECQMPSTGAPLTLSGLNAYGAATHCAALLVANKPHRSSSALANTSAAPPSTAAAASPPSRGPFGHPAMHQALSAPRPVPWRQTRRACHTGYIAPTIGANTFATSADISAAMSGGNTTTSGNASIQQQLYSNFARTTRHGVAVHPASWRPPSALDQDAASAPSSSSSAYSSNSSSRGLNSGGSGHVGDGLLARRSRSDGGTTRAANPAGLQWPRAAQSATAFGAADSFGDASDGLSSDDEDDELLQTSRAARRGAAAEERDAVAVAISAASSHAEAAAMEPMQPQSDEQRIPAGFGPTQVPPLHRHYRPQQHYQQQRESEGGQRPRPAGGRVLQPRPVATPGRRATAPGMQEQQQQQQPPAAGVLAGVSASCRQLSSWTRLGAAASRSRSNTGGGGSNSSSPPGTAGSSSSGLLRLRGAARSSVLSGSSAAATAVDFLSSSDSSSSPSSSSGSSSNILPSMPSSVISSAAVPPPAAAAAAATMHGVLCEPAATPQSQQPTTVDRVVRLPELLKRTAKSTAASVKSALQALARPMQH